MTVHIVTMVRNEEDIIETFVRYHSGTVDRMIIVDNGSTDRTPEVLALLRDEGLPIEILYEPSAAYTQSQIVTNCVRRAFVEHDASFVLPIDVDEFLSLWPQKADAKMFQLRLSDLPTDRVSRVQWVTFVPTPDDDLNQMNPLVRLSSRRKVQWNKDGKVIVPRQVFEERPDLVVGQGNHRVTDGSGATVPSVDLEDLVLLHYPLRSVFHARTKYLIGWLANLARPERVLFDWLPAYHLGKANELDADQVYRLALTYNTRPDAIGLETVCDPADIRQCGWDGTLRYTQPLVDQTLTRVLAFAEQLADEVSVARGRLQFGGVDLSSDYIMERIYGYQCIPGWLSDREASLLYRAVASVQADVPVVCEIGTWLGRSACVLGSALIYEKLGGQLFCVDPMDGSGDPVSQLVYQRQVEVMRSSPRREFLRNLARWGLQDVVQLVQRASAEARSLVPEQLDVLFLDGDHSSSAIASDFEIYAERVRKGGFVILHDVGSARFDGPRRVVEEHIIGDPRWDTHTLVDEAFLARRVGGR